MKIETVPPVPEYDFVITLTLTEFKAMHHILGRFSENDFKGYGLTKEEYLVSSDLWNDMNNMLYRADHGL